MDDEKRFSRTVSVTLEEGGVVHGVSTVREASDLLMSIGWPNRGDRHREAADTCMKVLEGARSTVDAEKAFLAAVEEAEILAID